MSGNEYDERPGGRIRIGDQEREDAVTRLGAHYEAGRLSAEEHTERVGDALQAKTEADLVALFADLPGEGGAAPEGAAEEGWAGPFGWARPPWTAPEDRTAGAQGGPGGPGGQGGSRGRSGPAGWGGPGGQGRPGSGGRGPWGAGGPPWAQRKGPFGRIPLPVLIALAVLGVLVSIACTVGGGHPPVLPLLLIVAAVVIVKNRRRERRA
jgi:hypothetical protein